MEGQEPTNQGQEPNPAPSNGQEPEPQVVDENTPVAVDQLPANVQKMIRELRTENAKERRQYADQLREAAKKAEKGSEAEKALAEALRHAQNKPN